MLKKLAPALAFSLVAASNGFAAMPLITDDTGTQGASGNQLELSVTQEKMKDASTGADTKSLQLPALSFTRGVSETIDVFVAATWLKNTDNTSGATEKGSSNPSLGVKWRLFENERKTSVALKAVYAFPVSEEKQTKSLGDGKGSWDSTLILSQELPFGSAHANIGIGKIGVKNGNDEKTTHISVAPMFNVGESAKLVFDLGQDTAKADGANKSTTRYWEIGGIYSPSKDIDLAVGYVRSKLKNSEEITKAITAGLTWRF